MEAQQISREATGKGGDEIQYIFKNNATLEEQSVMFSCCFQSV
jgi:hypothetical protein